ncbi:hypothetical protein F5Y04DRAFT_71198 [Hypomontagnella monticulosa]|nr:hypothetical protein F5Y04DRAFT_71198 [Hypomontagnella monticulosa]
MAEPENFEDDLFADLYDDNEAAAAPAAAAAAAAAPVAQAAQAPPPIATPTPAQLNAHQSVEAPSQQPEIDQVYGDPTHTIEENDGYGDDYQDEPYEDDDDVDFNLGNGSAGAIAAAQQEHDDSASAYHSTRGPSAKEDG